MTTSPARLALASLVTGAALALSMYPTAADAQTKSAAKPAPKPAAKARPAKAAAKAPANARSERRAAQLAQETVEQVNAAQMDVASRVLTGTADCEFGRQVKVDAIDGKPGHFHVGMMKARYQMVPQETTTGAVRLEDKKAGMVWLQIPAKSMLMNAKIGQRVADGCTMSEQRAAVEAVQAATAAEAASAAAAAAAPAPAPAPAVAAPAAPAASAN